MPASDFLQTLAEISIAFAGFASIVVAFQRRDAESWTPPDALRYQMMLSSSLASLFFSILPIAIHYCGFSDQIVGRTSSALLALFQVLVFVLSGLPSIRLVRERSLNLSIFIAFSTVSFSVFLAQLVNLRVASPGLFIVGVLYLLGTAGLEFYRLVQVKLPAA